MILAITFIYRKVKYISTVEFVFYTQRIVIDKLSDE